MKLFKNKKSQVGLGFIAITLGIAMCGALIGFAIKMFRLDKK